MNIPKLGGLKKMGRLRRTSDQINMIAKVFDQIFYKWLTIPLPRRIVLDSAATSLRAALVAVHCGKISTVEDLGISPGARGLHAKLKETAAKSKRLGLLVITTRNLKPDGYDVLRIPGSFSAKDLAESIKIWLFTTNIGKIPKSRVYGARPSRSKFTTRYVFDCRKWGHSI